MYWISTKECKQTWSKVNYASTKTWNNLKSPTTIYKYLKNLNNHLKNIYSHSQTI